MAYTLPDLPYPADALEPHIDAQTMTIHHDKHHNAYVTKVNDALKGTEWENKPIDEVLRNLDKLPADKQGAVRNNGGGHYNHSLFWTAMKPGGGGQPSGELAQAIDRDLGGFEKFKEDFSNAAATRFGSGWAWLCMSPDGKLHVTSTLNQDAVIMPEKFGGVSPRHVPLLGIDVWEHAYYLKYQNKRPDYVAAWWNTVNWDEVAKRYSAGKSAAGA